MPYQVIFSCSVDLRLLFLPCTTSLAYEMEHTAGLID